MGIKICCSAGGLLNIAELNQLTISSINGKWAIDRCCNTDTQQIICKNDFLRLHHILSH